MKIASSRCVLCKEVAWGTPSATEVSGSSSVKVLPCLHACCEDCISRHVEVENLSPGAIFACPLCAFKIQLPKNGATGFKELPTSFRYRGKEEEMVNGLIRVKGTQLGTLKSKSSDHADDSRIQNGEHDSVEEGGEEHIHPVNAQSGTKQQILQDSEFIVTNECSNGEVDTSQELTRSVPGVPMLTCVHCDTVLPKTAVQYCNACDKIVCEDCRITGHADHQSIDIESFLKNKKEYITKLLGEVQGKMRRDGDKCACIDRVKVNLFNTKQEIEAEIQTRAAQLCQMIERRKEYLLAELNEVYDQHTQMYDDQKSKLKCEVEVLQHAAQFTEGVSGEDAEEKDLLDFHNDITNQLMHLIHDLKETRLEVLSLKLDAPERGKEESHLEKLFGSLVQGNVSCGSADLVTSFDVDLKWPTGIAFTKFSKELVIAGKTGAFEAKGKLLFYNRQGHHLTTYDFEENCIPNDVKCAQDGSVVVCDNNGRIIQFSGLGIVLRTLHDKFKGFGQVFVSPDGNMIVSSSEDKALHWLSKTGEILERQSLQDFKSGLLGGTLHPHGVAVNGDSDVIVTDLKNSLVTAFNNKMELLYQYRGDPDECGAEPGVDSQPLKCPSAICCDPFDNLLVADFTNDSIHLVSKSGQFLGYLLTKDNGISCPNCLALDHEGHLFIGQYGGEVLVFRYLSCIKHA